MSDGVAYPDAEDEKGRRLRLDLLKQNVKPIEITYLEGLRTLPEEEIVVVVFDPRDSIGRQYGIALWSEEKVDDALAKLTLEVGEIPTMVVFFPRSNVIEALEQYAPRTSERMEWFDVPDSFPVLVVASGGTSMGAVYKPKVDKSKGKER